MALRIGPSAANAGAPPPEELMEEPVDMPMAPEMPVEEPMPEASTMQSGMVSPEAAKYLTADQRCGSCIHYMDAGQSGSCEIVTGPIDPMGVCLLFSADTEPITTEEPQLGAEIPEDTSGDQGAAV